MSLIRLSLRKKRFISSTPSTGMAIPRGAVNGWGTAADFYDSVGVNYGRIFTGERPRSEAITLTAQLGVRHIRDATLPSWNAFQSANFGQPFWNDLRTRNRALPAPTSTDRGHPIFLETIVDPWGPTLANRVTQEMQAFVSGQSTFNPAVGASRRISWGVDFTPQGIMQFFGGGHQHYNGDSNQNAAIPFVGNPLSDAQQAFSSPECPWEIISHIGPANEPGGFVGVKFVGGEYGQENRELMPWCHSLKVAKDAQTGQGYGQAGVTLSGNSRIVTENGLVTQAPNRSQIAVGGFVVQNFFWVYFDGNSAYQDASRGAPNQVDTGDLHPYNYAEEPSEEQRDGTGLGYTGLTGWSTYFNSSRDPYNGSQNPSPSDQRGRDTSRELPKFITEWGLCDRNDFVPMDAVNGSGQWPSPKDVNAEYTVRQVLLGWFWGIRRTFIYQLRDERSAGDGEANLGLFDSNSAPKPSASALKNLLQLVGFSTPSNNPKTQNVTISGYPTGQVNQIHNTAGTVIRQTVKKLHSFQIQQDDDNWLLVLSPGVKLWDFIRGSRNSGDTGWQTLGNPTLGRITPATETLTITLPAEITDAQVAWPTRGLTPSGSSYTWATPDSGLNWDTLTISGARQITVTIDRYTKIVKLTRGVPAVPPTLPIVVPSVGSTPASLRTGTTSGPRLNLKGINIWGLPDDITNNVTVGGPSFHTNQHTNRVTILNEVQSWGANCVRLRAHAADYNGAPSAATDSLTKTQILDRVVDWVTAAKAENMYTVICPWDGLDGPYSGANFPAQYTNTFQFYTDVFARLGTDPMVMYETPNEPNGISMAQWQTIMQGYSTHFRDTMGYKGVLVMDPPNWANSGGSTSPAGNPAGYSDATYSAVEAFDAARSGMNGKHQLVFAKHDYSNNSGYPGNVFSQTNWVNGMGGTDIKHLIWANEFGNFNAGGPDPDSNAQWAIDYSIAARDRWAGKQNYAGAAPFLFGPWSDLNAMTATPSNTTRTTWGNTAHDYYFGASSPPPPPPSGGLTPGVHFNGNVQGAANGAVTLGAKIVRVEFAASDAATSLDATFTYYADRGLKILLLAAIGAPTLISSGTAANLGTWAARFGPGGTFWASYGGTDRPISHIEFGNETGFNWQQPAGQGSGTAAYQAKARLYATLFTSAYNAIQSANPAVGLLCQATANDSGDPSWVNNLFVQEPGLAARVAGWTYHPYTPDWQNRVANNLVADLASRDPNKPLDFTEIGIATDNGRTITPDNYNWSTTMTYSQCATSIQGVIVGMHQQAWWPRVRHWMWYQALDNQPSGTGATANRESFFGALQSNGAAKGALTTQIQTIMAMTS